MPGLCRFAALPTVERWLESGPPSMDLVLEADHPRDWESQGCHRWSTIGGLIVRAPTGDVVSLPQRQQSKEF